MLTHSNNICIEGKLEFDGWIFPLFTEISMIYWMDGRKREGGKTREDEICGVVDLSLIFLGLRSP